MTFDNDSGFSVFNREQPPGRCGDQVAANKNGDVFLLVAQVFDAEFFEKLIDVFAIK